ncbi:MAG TPA: cytochrome c oxidase assembly protein [Aquabacterium sp.]|nr:cytochrome c oxidase assembly protein [Aquabacterium sp.]
MQATGKLPLFSQRLRRANLSMVGKLVVVAGLMFAFGYAMVPMYKHICTALGINVLSLSEQDTPGALATRKANTQVDTTRTVTVEFDANARGPWEFKPERHYVDIHPGQITTVMYEFKNVQDRTMVAQAIPSYAPKQASPYFNKLECFCFSEHTLKPGESKRWPVTFVVDPKLPKDVQTITLSYTFFEVGGRLPGAGGG